MNPNAIVFWTLAAIIGYLIGEVHGALVGIACAMGLSFVVSIFSR